MENEVVEKPGKSKSLAYYEKYMVFIGVVGQLLFYSQGIKIFINKSASDVSIVGFCLGFISVTSWLIYGLLIKNRVLIIANAFAVLGALFVIIGILIYG